MHIETLEKRSLTTCTPDETLDHVARLLCERDLEVVAIVDPPGILVGLVTSRDVSVTAHENHPVAAANTGARSGPRHSDPDFTWMLAEKSIPIDVGENFWGL